MTARSIALSLIACLALAGCQDRPTGSYSDSDAAAGATFRFLARDIVAALDPVCPLVEQPENDAIYEGLRGRMDALEQRIAGTPHEVDLAVVRGDYREYWRHNSATCDAPDTPANVDRARREIATIEARMEALESAI